MKLDEIHQEWAKDSIIDRTNIDVEAINIPKIHSKYLKILSTERIRYKALLEKKRILEQQLFDYFQGKLDGKDIGREPWQLTDTKATAEKRVANDKEIVSLTLNIVDAEERVVAVKEIIFNLNQRNFQLKVAVDFLKFQNGQ